MGWRSDRFSKTAATFKERAIAPRKTQKTQKPGFSEKPGFLIPQLTIFQSVQPSDYMFRSGKIEQQRLLQFLHLGDR